MRIIHTADLHLGQILYQNYDRGDEHRHYFTQLEQWCMTYHPDALVVSGDVFDIQQPSAATKRAFTEYFVALRQKCPAMHIIITAGNHDSASRIQADSAVWDLVNTHLVGLPPAMDLQNGPDGWQERFIVRLENGYVVALPYMIGDRRQQIQSILDRIAAENQAGLPVVVMGHLAVTSSDPMGQGFEIGKIKTIDMESLGNGYDYFALGHIHKPQTIGHKEDDYADEVSYPAPVVRYSGSTLHVSCDETFPHSVSLVEIDRHGGTVNVKQLVISELRHFYVLPSGGGSFQSEQEAIDAIRDLAKTGEECYFRLCVDRKTYLSESFNQIVYDIIAENGDRLRYNPKHIWTGEDENLETDDAPLVFEVAELQQMTDPMNFIEKTMKDYPDLDLEELREAFEEVKVEVAQIKEEKNKKSAPGKKSATSKEEPTENNEEL